MIRERHVITFYWLGFDSLWWHFKNFCCRFSKIRWQQKRREMQIKYKQVYFVIMVGDYLA